jgi:D-alanyl-D-alanine carboxypeptidase
VRHVTKVSRDLAVLAAATMALVSCASDAASLDTTTPSTSPASSASGAEVTVEAGRFPTAPFVALGDHKSEPVRAELDAQLQGALEDSARGAGVTATLLTPYGAWSGATGRAAGERRMVAGDQMAIGGVTKTLVAAQLMQLVEAGELALDDLVEDRLPPDLVFDTNHATIADLMSMRSGYPDTFEDEEAWAGLWAHPLRSWTTQEALATVGPERGPVGQEWEYRGSNYLLLGQVIEHVTGRSITEVLRAGVLAGDGYQRLINQPDERPTQPMAIPDGAAADTLDEIGGYLPSRAAVTAGEGEGGMASDSASLARWWRGLCAGQIVSSSSLDEMTDFEKWPEYALGVVDRRDSFGWDSGALGNWAAHPGVGMASMALCIPDPGLVLVVLSNNDVDPEEIASTLVRIITS